MRCNSCGYEGKPNLEETGPHTKALCQQCGKYIKMVGKDELGKIVNQFMNPTLKIWTAQYQYSGKDRVDITIKSAGYPWNVFAPTWEMVMEYKRMAQKGRAVEAESVYVKQYTHIIEQAWKTHHQQLSDLLKSDRIITLVCFCRPGDFCHRVLLAKHFESLGATYLGERG
jgi:uncharacterized protein YeaO (DUF488 family)